MKLIDYQQRNVIIIIIHYYTNQYKSITEGFPTTVEIFSLTPDQSFQSSLLHQQRMIDNSCYLYILLKCESQTETNYIFFPYHHDGITDTTNVRNE